MLTGNPHAIRIYAMPMPLPGLTSASDVIVAIVGRPNVGKSTLFNRILGTRHAIVDDVPGVTRDRNYANCTYQNRSFHLVDTGGIDPSSIEPLVSLVTRQSQHAIAEASIIIFLMDGRAGLTPLDREIASMVRKSGKPVYYAVNKIDSPKSESLLADFYELGQQQLFPISAEQGIGVDDLLEAFLPLLPIAPQSLEEATVPHVAVIGRPNTGKSTLVNTILGQDRVVVSAIPGTTRDPVDSVVTFKDRRYVMTDTAGIRRRGRIDRGIEGYSVARTLKAVGRSDLAILLVDGVEGVTEQDTKIAGMVLKQGRGCIIFVNKWDLHEGELDSHRTFFQELRRRLPFMHFVPVIFGSALSPGILDRLFPEIDRVVASFTHRIPTGQLNQFFQKVLEQNPLPLKKGSLQRSVYITQVATRPPTFALFVRQAIAVKEPYLRYLENKLREKFGFEGTPIRILVREK